MIDREAWLTAVRDVLPPDDPQAITMQQFSAMLGVAPTTAKTRMAELLQQGRAERLDRVTVGANGKRCYTPVYRLLTPDTKP